MKKYIDKVLNAPYAFAAMVTVAMMEANEAQAADKAGTIATDLTSQVGNIGKLMIAGSFLGGIVMLGSGLMKLKQAAESQGTQTKYSEGMWRVGVGAGLVAIPTFGSTLTNTFSLGDVSMTNASGF
jgi:hypothetical protein